MIKLGLTGSIGMGKTTVASFFKQAGVPVFNADDAVSHLYQQPEVVGQLAKYFPQAIVNNQVDRQKLAQCLFQGNRAEQQRVQKLEAIIHPLVHAAEEAFVAHAFFQKTPLIVLDIPLLFETLAKQELAQGVAAELEEGDEKGVNAQAGIEVAKAQDTLKANKSEVDTKMQASPNQSRIDYIAVVSAPYEVQRARVLARPNMSEQKFQALLARQISDEEKRLKADFILDTAKDKASTRQEVLDLIKYLTN